MKKLMIAAAAAAMVSGAFAAVSNCTFTPDSQDPVEAPAAVYAWKFTGKTTVGTPVSTKAVTSPTSDCGFGGETTPGDSCVLRVPGTLAIQGYVYYCDNCCDRFVGGTEKANLAEFYMTKPYQAKIEKPTITLNADATHIIGKTPSQYEAEGTAKFDAKKTGAGALVEVTFAGLGSFNYKQAVVTSVSGNFAGTLKSPYYVSKKVCSPADYWVCGYDWAGNPYAPTVAYGTWSAKYNASASKIYKRDGKTVTLPSWAR
jgi:hypothetical protein